MNLSLCITTYNRFELLQESYAQVLDDSRISEIIIVDDCSTEPGIKEKVNSLAGGKVKVFHQAQNRGMSRNKADAISYASNDFAIILDSDNVIGPDYLDAIPKELSSDVIYCPSFAKPDFNYTSYEGWTLIYDDASEWLKKDMLNTCMNTCNYLVHRETYLKTYQHNPVHIASDTIWHAYNHLKAGGSFYIVPGMHYYHRVHKGSGFLQGVDHNMRMQAEVRKMIMELK
jgi:glycosyltransferase involved in cell wall biosynthesis